VERLDRSKKKSVYKERHEPTKGNTRKLFLRRKEGKKQTKKGGGE
jgi:hypothetical protein